MSDLTGMELTCITVQGGPREMGEGIGESLRERIRSLVSHRLDVARCFLEERGVGDALSVYREAGQACLEHLSRWDADGHEELAGTARAADVPLLDLYAVSNLTDVRDIASRDRHVGDSDEGCTAFMVPEESHAPLILGQTWDLNRGDVEYVVGIHRLPDDAPETWSVTVAGTPTLIGMNEHGLWVGTTNIRVRGSRPGVGYLDIQHRALRERDFESAVRVASEAPRAAAHTYWYADPNGGAQLECSASKVVARPLGREPLVQTNHCLDPEHVETSVEPATPSSCRRLDRAKSLLADGVMDVDRMKRIMSDRSDGSLSINRLPEDNEPTTTNACMLGIPATRTFQACRGSADRGEWVALAFDRGR